MIFVSISPFIFQCPSWRESERTDYISVMKNNQICISMAIFFFIFRNRSLSFSFFWGPLCSSTVYVRLRLNPWTWASPGFHRVKFRFYPILGKSVLTNHPINFNWIEREGSWRLIWMKSTSSFHSQETLELHSLVWIRSTLSSADILGLSYMHSKSRQLQERLNL